MPEPIDLSVSAWLIVSLAMFLGAIVQSTIGFGMVVLALPVVLIAAPDLVPGPLSVATMLLVLPVALVERHAALRDDLWRLIPGRFLGAGLGLALLAIARGDTLVVVAALIVLAAVAATVWAPPLPRNDANLVGAGVVSGTFAMAVSIGGPPLALLYQHAKGPEIRSTVSFVFAAGIPITLIGLILGGHLDTAGFITGASIWPAVFAGYGVAARIRHRVDDRIRPIVLIVSAGGALVALGRVLLG